MRSRKIPLVLHFVTWYPTASNHAEGVFIQRQIELLATNENFRHIVVRKCKRDICIWEHLKALFGFFITEQVGTIMVVSLPKESRLYNFFFWRFREKIEQLILDRLYRKFYPKLMHLHVVYGFAKEALYLKKKKNLQFIVSEHMGPFPFDWITPKDRLIIQPIMQSFKVVAVSEAQARQIKSFTGVTPIVIPNVVNENEFYFSSTVSSARSKQELQLVFTGVYSKAKGCEYLLNVLPEFIKYYPNVKLHLVGKASEERMKELNSIIEQKGIEKYIQFHGNLSAAQLNKLYQQCDFYVCCSEWESFGLSVLEGLFTGLPALCTDCGGVSDFICDDNGMLISNDQQAATLLNGMLQMADRHYQYNPEQIATQVRTRFSRTLIKEQYLNIYQEVIKSSSAV